MYCTLYCTVQFQQHPTLSAIPASTPNEQSRGHAPAPFDCYKHTVGTVQTACTVDTSIPTCMQARNPTIVGAPRTLPAVGQEQLATTPCRGHRHRPSSPPLPPLLFPSSLWTSTVTGHLPARGICGSDFAGGCCEPSGGGRRLGPYCPAPSGGLAVTAVPPGCLGGSRGGGACAPLQSAPAARKSRQVVVLQDLDLKGGQKPPLPPIVQVSLSRSDLDLPSGTPTLQDVHDLSSLGLVLLKQQP